MNRLGNILNLGLRKIESLLDSPFIEYNGKRYPCILSTERRGSVVELGGMVYEVQFSVIIRKDATGAVAFITADTILVSADDTLDIIEATEPEFKAPVRVLADAPISDLSDLPAQIDGVSITEGDRVLLAAQTDALDNGIYSVVDSELVRASDLDESLEVTDSFCVNVQEGVQYMQSQWRMISPVPLVLGVEEINFVEVPDDEKISPGGVTVPYSGRHTRRGLRHYRIASVREDGPGSHWSLDLIDVNR